MINQLSHRFQWTKAGRAYPVVVVDVWRFLNLLVRRDEEIARCDEISVVLVDGDGRRHEIGPLKLRAAVRSMRVGDDLGGRGEDTNRTEDGDGLGLIIGGYGEAREGEKP